jgi:hypothetical protein
MSMSSPRVTFHEQTGKLVTSDPAETGGAVNTVREYVTSQDGKRPPFQRRVSDAAYSETISSIVVKTCDAIIYDPDTGRIMIGARDREPHSGDWVIGGRKYAGDTDKETAVHNIERELGSDIAVLAKERLQPVGTQYDVIWDSREQPSSQNEEGELVTGVHQSVTLFALPVSEVEFNALATHNEEYSGLRWEDPFDILEAPEGKYHPAYRDMVYDTLERVITIPKGQPALR